MRTISWKQPLIALLIGGALAVACSDDSPAPVPEEGGKLCGNGKVDEGEKCDPKKLRTCSEATMDSKPSGVTKCSADCKTEDISGCKAAGTGGGGGMGGGTGGVVGMGGGPGGRPGKDGGSDAAPDAPAPGKPDATPDAAKPDAVVAPGAGGTGGTGGASTDAGKG